MKKSRKEEVKAADAAMFDVRGLMFDVKLTESRNRIAKSGELIRPPVNLTSMSDVVQTDLLWLPRRVLPGRNFAAGLIELCFNVIG